MNPNHHKNLQFKTFNFPQSTQPLCVIKSNLQTLPILFLLFTVLTSLASCLVETTILVETILLTTLLLENDSVHLPNFVIND